MISGSVIAIKAAQKLAKYCFASSIICFATSLPAFAKSFTSPACLTTKPAFSAREVIAVPEQIASTPPG